MERLPGDLDAVTVRLLSDPQEAREWDRLMAEQHYLKSARMMGEQLRYVAEVRGVWLALLGWSAAVLKVGCRDTHIGWSDLQKRQRLHLVANNARFLVLPAGRTPNLASRVLGMCTRRLSGDWQERYGHAIVAVETFVEEARFAGVCYQAAGWKELGLTAGYRRDRAHDYACHGVKKRHFFKELRPAACAMLHGPSVPEDRAITRYPIARLPITESLFAIIARHVPDPRDRRGRRYRLSSLLAVLLVGMVCGCQHPEDVEAWADALDERQRERLRLPWSRTQRRRSTPDAETLRNVLRDIDPQALPRAAAEWMRSIGINTTNTSIAIDGKTLCGSAGTGEPAKVVTAYAAESGAVLMHYAIPRGTTEVPVARTMLAELDLTDSLCTFDAAHATPETALVVRKKGATTSCPSRATSPPFTPTSRPPSTPAPALAPASPMTTRTDATRSAASTA